MANKEEVGFEERNTTPNAFVFQNESWGRCNMDFERKTINENDNTNYGQSVTGVVIKFYKSAPICYHNYDVIMTRRRWMNKF